MAHATTLFPRAFKFMTVYVFYMCCLQNLGLHKMDWLFGGCVFLSVCCSLA